MLGEISRATNESGASGTRAVPRVPVVELWPCESVSRRPDRSARNRGVAVCGIRSQRFM